MGSGGITQVRGRARVRLSDEVLEHLWDRFPTHCAVLADAQTRRVVDLCIDRAAANGFQAKDDVCSWASLMVVFGSYFDEDPQLPWVRESLRGAREDQSPMDRLFGKATEVLQELAGADGERYRSALAWVMKKPFGSIGRDYGGSLAEAPRRWLRDLHPEKFSFLPPERMDRLLQASSSATARHGLTTLEGNLVYAGLMFLLGSSIDRDPVYPWVGEVLSDPALADPGIKAQAVHKRAIAELVRFTKLDRLTQGA